MGKYVPSTSEEQQEMLKAVGVSSFDELYTVVPSGMKVDRLAIPEGEVGAGGQRNRQGHGS